MVNKNEGMRKNGSVNAISKEDLQERIESKLMNKGVVSPKLATAEQLYQATVNSLKDLMLEKRDTFKRIYKEANSKKVCYLCMEFLVGRGLLNEAVNLGVYNHLSEILSEFGSSFDKIYACEIDPGLGNGGLGRLAACFMDSLTDMGYNAGGYSLLYENGLFKQRIIDGEQIELPDEWLSKGGIRLVPHPERSVAVKLGGKIEEKFENGKLTYNHYDYDTVKAVPYDLLIPGNMNNAVNTIRLWRAKSVNDGNIQNISQSSYLIKKDLASRVEEITKQLYPSDNYDEGKLLRLSQQYLLVSASLQSILFDYLAEHGSLSGFEDGVSIHINDTHPALAIPELMRIFLDAYSYSWDDAWNIVTKTVSYTNHTVLPEALETWRVDLFSIKLPRIFMIIEEINRRFTADLWNMYPGDWDRISRMSIIAYNQVRMANLSIVGSHSVNGVSKLHSEILKSNVFHDFYKMTPEKFKNVTNGVYHRRWLLNANPRLCDFLDEKIGKEYRDNPILLSKLMEYTSEDTIDELFKVKKYNKNTFSYYAFNKLGKRIDPSSIFDVQIKRLHEYKRQLLNLLKILSLYIDLEENPNINFRPITFIFGCKAAPGYTLAKKIIKLIWFLAKELENNSKVNDKLNILFIEDYNVSWAEALIPSADISEQISLAGKEASGTGCMKLMMNGAITLGTPDGANIEILEEVGRENFYGFGLNAREADEIWRSGYNANSYYRSSVRLRKVIDRLYRPISGENFAEIADYLIRGDRWVADPFMCLADFESYINTFEKLIADYGNSAEWGKKSLVNIAKSGVFSSNVSIDNYARNIWNIKPVLTSRGK